MLLPWLPRLGVLGQEVVLRHVRARLAQCLDACAAAVPFKPLDPPVEVGYATGVLGHARLHDIGKPLKRRQVVQPDGVFGMREDLARGRRGGVPRRHPAEAVAQRFLAEGEPQLLTADPPGRMV